MESLRFAVAAVAYVLVIFGVVFLLSSALAGLTPLLIGAACCAIGGVLIAIHRYTGRGRL